MDTQQLTSPHRRQLYAYFMDIFRKSAGDTFEERWNWLTAAHIVGQNDLRLHLHSHAVMLAFAASTRDWPEVFGQLIRLALVPVGHLAGKLPAGISAAQPLTRSGRCLSMLRCGIASAPRGGVWRLSCRPEKRRLFAGESSLRAAASQPPFRLTVSSVVAGG